jgi:hypothetical protein
MKAGQLLPKKRLKKKIREKRIRNESKRVNAGSDAE